MDISQESVADRLNGLRINGWIPPHAVWLQYLLATSGATPLAEVAEREEHPEGGSSLAYTALFPNRIVRVIATGRGRWEEPRTGQPDEVSVRSLPLDRAAFTFEDTRTQRPEFGDEFTIETILALDVDNEVVRIPHLRRPYEHPARVKIDEFLLAVMKVLNS